LNRNTLGELMARNKYKRKSLAKRIRAAAWMGQASLIATLWAQAQQLRLTMPQDVMKGIEKPTKTRRSAK
jgi:hypothetical protein